MSMTIDDMISMYVKIRDAKAEAKKAFDKEVERMTQAMLKLEGLMQDQLNGLGVETIKAESGTVYQKLRSSVSVHDRDEFYNWAVANNELGAIDMKANAPAVRELLQKGTQVPGVKYSESYQIGVRRKSQ